MIQIINVYRQKLPRLRFIGKRYADSDRVDGSFGHLWEQWFKEAYFAALEANSKPASCFDDANAPLGLMRFREKDHDFQYWIGLFRAADSPVPDGFESADFDASDVGIAWIQGPENELYKNEMQAFQRMTEEGYKIQADAEGATWFFERYSDERFMPENSDALPILDIGVYIASED